MRRLIYGGTTIIICPVVGVGYLKYQNMSIIPRGPVKKISSNNSHCVETVKQRTTSILTTRFACSSLPAMNVAMVAFAVGSGDGDGIWAWRICSCSRRWGRAFAAASSAFKLTIPDKKKNCQISWPTTKPFGLLHLCS
jgi:hypothetical protein